MSEPSLRDTIAEAIYEEAFKGDWLREISNRQADAALRVIRAEVEATRPTLTATNGDDERVQWIERDALLRRLGGGDV